MTTSTGANSYPFAGAITGRMTRNIARSVAVARRETESWPWPPPANSVLASFEERTTVLDVLDALADDGISPSNAGLASGLGGAALLRAEYARRSVPARIAGLIADDRALMEAAAAACEQGAAVMLIRAPNGRLDEVAGIVAAHSGRLLRRSGRWTFSGNDEG